MAEEKIEKESQEDLAGKGESPEVDDVGVEALREEVAQLQRQVDEHQVAAKARQHRGRGWAVGLILLGCILPAIVEGRAVLKALEGMVRQPEVAGQLRQTLIVAMALLESTAIYVLLVVLILIFANPLIEHFFGV